MQTFSFEAAQDKFDEILDIVQCEAVKIMRNNEVAAFIISPQVFQEVKNTMERLMDMLQEK